jgi:hypothetical protein
MREVSLAGVKLVSHQQPDKLRIDEHRSGPPAIWLHSDPPKTAWIIVDTGALDWCKLAYQFGHELGQVLCNSWAQRLSRARNTMAGRSARRSARRSVLDPRARPARDKLGTEPAFSW